MAYEAAFTAADRSAASRLEFRIKNLSRAQKLQLISGETIPSLELENYSRAELPIIETEKPVSE